MLVSELNDTQKGFYNMKKLICTILACTIGAVSLAALNGCGCNDGKSAAGNQESKQGYEVVATQPDLQNESFGFYILNEKELMLTKYFGSETNITVPDTYQKYTVTTIGHSVFNNDGIKSITVPESITDIQDYAFASNKGLTSVKLPSKLTHLGTNVFFYCSSLETIELPASLEKIDAFAFCASGLKTIVIPESNTLTELPEYMFHQCPGLKEVTIPETITKIAENCFNECPSDLTLKVVEGSYAEDFAKDQKLNYETL